MNSNVTYNILYPFAHAFHIVFVQHFHGLLLALFMGVTFYWIFMFMFHLMDLSRMKMNKKLIYDKMPLSTGFFHKYRHAHPKTALVIIIVVPALVIFYLIGALNP